MDLTLAFSEQAVRYGIGSSTTGFIRRFKNQNEANAAFVQAYMAQDIVATSE